MLGDLTLVRPTRDHLAGFVAALEAGWSPNTLDPDYGRRILGLLGDDADAYLDGLTDRDPQGAMIDLPDGSRVPRLPQTTRWMWDGEFCGSIGFRWVSGTEELPPHVLGHIGYAVVPWKQGRGIATAAVGLILADAAAEGLRWVEISTDPDNVASQRVIERNGGVLVERFAYPAAYGRADGLRYRVAIAAGV